MSDYTRLIKNFKVFKNSKNNFLKTCSLEEQVDLFQFLQDDEFDTQKLLDNITTTSNTKYLNSDEGLGN